MSGFGERLTYALPRTAWNTVHVSIVTHSRVTVPVSKILNLGVNLPSPPGARGICPPNAPPTSAVPVPGPGMPPRRPAGLALAPRAPTRASSRLPTTFRSALPGGNQPEALDALIAMLERLGIRANKGTRAR
jgi:hypothetical protein